MGSVVIGYAIVLEDISNRRVAKPYYIFCLFKVLSYRETS